MYNYTNYGKQYQLPQNAIEGYQIPNVMPAGRQNVLGAHEGLMRGNLFADLYDPYISAEPFQLRPTDEREDLLNRVREYDFANIDLDLYLDVHPNDEEKIRIYNEYLNEGKRYRYEYEKAFGPLSLESETLANYPWLWIRSPWPWEVK